MVGKVIEQTEYTTYGECNPTCGEGTRTVYRKYDFYRMTGCEKKDKKIETMHFYVLFNTHSESVIREL